MYVLILEAHMRASRYYLLVGGRAPRPVDLREAVRGQPNATETRMAREALRALRAGRVYYQHDVR